MSKVKPTDKQRLEIAKWFCEQAVAFNQGKSLSCFKTDIQLNLASTMAITQAAEQLKEVSEAVQMRYPDFPWKQIIALRNVIAHNYDGIFMDVVWETITEHLPITIEKLADILSNDSDLLSDDESVKDKYEFKTIADLQTKS